jgi:hypothetical protein
MQNKSPTSKDLDLLSLGHTCIFPPASGERVDTIHVTKLNQSTEGTIATRLARLRIAKKPKITTIEIGTPCQTRSFLDLGIVISTADIVINTQQPKMRVEAANLAWRAGKLLLPLPG